MAFRLHKFPISMSGMFRRTGLLGRRVGRKGKKEKSKVPAHTSESRYRNDGKTLQHRRTDGSWVNDTVKLDKAGMKAHKRLRQNKRGRLNRRVRRARLRSADRFVYALLHA